MPVTHGITVYPTIDPDIAKEQAELAIQDFKAKFPDEPVPMVAGLAVQVSVSSVQHYLDNETEYADIANALKLLAYAQIQSLGVGFVESIEIDVHGSTPDRQN